MTPTAARFLHSFRSLAAVFRPPFDGLGLVVVLYVAWAYLVCPHSPVLRGDLPDTDDYMYLNQVLDWMKGQGWYDNVQHRLNPPAAVPIHFSRLAQLPMAAIVGVFELLGLGPKGGATLMALLYPLILLGVLFAVLRWVAESFMPKEWAGVTAFIGLFATNTLYLFQPGHVDHHNLIVIFVVLALGCALRMMQRPELHRWPVYAGLCMAAGLTVALEILPWLLLLSAYLGFWAAAKGGNAARSGLLYSLVLFAGSAFFLALTRPPADILNLDVLTYSAVYVILAAGVAVAFAGVFLAAKAPRAVRLTVGLLLSTGAGALFLRHFPDLIVGPYGGIDPALARIILDEVNEAKPMKTAADSWFEVALAMGGSLVAMPAGIVFLKKAKGEQRWLWGLLMALLTAALGLTLLYQRRFAGTANMLEIIPLAVLLQRGWDWIGARWRGRRQVLAEIGLLLLVGPLPAVLLPALYDGRSFNMGVLLFPVSFGPEEFACQSYELENALRDPLRFGGKPRLIMNPMGNGPELLFRTDHQVLAAPYHMDVEGNVDSTRFFSTPYPEEAEAIARRRKVDLVVTCLFASNVYFHASPWGQEPKNEGPGQDFAPHFIERLIAKRIPAWLKPVKVPGLTNYVIYEVLPPAPDAKTE
jgi:hypothetical protein